MIRTIAKLEAEIGVYAFGEVADTARPNSDMADFALRVTRMLPKNLYIPRTKILTSTGQIVFYWETPFVYADIELEPGDVMSVYIRFHAYDTADKIHVGAKTYFTDDVKTADELKLALMPLGELLK